MSRQQYKELGIRDVGLAVIQHANRILAEYGGMRLTLRQLYYQFVSRDLVPNTEQSYKRIGDIIGKGRLAGMIDWDAIEDRGRRPDVPAEWDGVSDIMSTVVRSYRLPRWENQDYYAELWVEKQALASVLEPLASKWHATLMVNKGYSSLSAMRESARRFIVREDKQKVLFYLGDHDPSGEDMVRDIRERLEMFGAVGLDVQKIALTMEQIQHFNPPPNPAKKTDSRYAEYIAKHGTDKSWEVDALPPHELGRLIDLAFADIIDMDKYNAMIEREKVHKAALVKFAKQYEAQHKDDDE